MLKYNNIKFKTYLENCPSAIEVSWLSFGVETTTCQLNLVADEVGGGPCVVVSTAAFHARVRGSVPGLGGLKETTCESQYCGEPP